MASNEDIMAFDDNELLKYIALCTDIGDYIVTFGVTSGNYIKVYAYGIENYLF